MFKLVVLLMLGVAGSDKPLMAKFVGNDSFKTQKLCEADAKKRVPMVVEDLKKRIPNLTKLQAQGICTDNAELLKMPEKKAEPAKPQGEQI